MRHRGIVSLVGALLAIAFLGLSCVDVPGGGATGGTVLYAYDSLSHQIIKWDASALYDSDSPTTLGTVGSTVFTNKMGNLAWGGLCLDANRNLLYLVNETTGDVVRVGSIRKQSGLIPPSSQDVATFTLGGTSERLDSGTFGQAAVDQTSGTLYVTEKNASATRIWVVVGAASLAQDSIVLASSTVTVTGDKTCTGVAAGKNLLYAYFDSGNLIGPDQIDGHRLRKGDSTGFASNASVLVGPTTTLGKYGTLALDFGNDILFVARHNVDASASGNPVLAFKIGQFGSAFNQAPNFTLGTAADQGSIRVLAHPGNKEWLAALNSSGDTPANVIHIWKLPRDTGSVAKIKNITAALFKGIAFDGSN